MCPQNKAGRPIYGAEGKSVMIKLRIEPYLSDQMTLVCRALGMSRSAFIRYAIEQLIRSYKMNRVY